MLLVIVLGYITIICVPSYFIHGLCHKIQSRPWKFYGDGEIRSEGNLVVMRATSGTRRMRRGFVSGFKGGGVLDNLLRPDKAICNL